MEKREEWRARVEGWRASGQGLAEFCRGKGFTPSNLRHWVMRLDAAGETGRLEAVLFAIARASIGGTK